jgi:Tfp pilus assembly protein PilE
MMPSKPHKIKAFTIMEVTVAMLIAAIVIGITYTAYNIISKTYGNFKKKNEDMAVLARLDQLLRRDFDRADLITESGHEMIFQKEGQPDIRYEIAPTYLVRNAISVDTFKVVNANYQVLFEGQLKNETENIDSDTNDKEEERIDELSFTVDFKDEAIPYHYEKKYSSENLIKRSPNAIN